MRMASRKPRSWAAVAGLSAALVAGFYLTAGEASAAERSARARPGSSSSQRAVPRGEATGRSSANRHQSRGSYTRRGHRGHRGSFHVGIGYGYPFYRWGHGLRLGFGYPYYGHGYGYSYYPYSWYYWPAYSPRYPYRGPWGGYRESELGALDLNVKPKKTEVFVDGEYAGTAGKLDGYPSYLWVPKGRHQLVFHLPGYQTIARDLTVVPGVVVDLRMRLEPGETTPPEQLMTSRPAPSTVPPDSRLPASRAPLPDRPKADDASRSIDLRGEPGRFQVAVVPGDASVYLDGRFLGTGDELGRLHSGLMVDPGDHQVEIVRPGYASRTLAFSVEAGEEVRLEVELEPAAGV